jgi:hypothetical protein
MEIDMAKFLESLSFTASKKAAADAQGDIRQKVREKMIAGVEEQRTIVQAEIDGETYRPTALRYVDQPDGTRKKVEVELKRMTRWHYKAGGKLYVELRYGTGALKNSNGLSAIEVGEGLDDVLNFYTMIVTAISQGKLDDELLEMSKARSEMRKGKKRGDNTPELVVIPEPEEEEYEEPVKQPLKTKRGR